MTVQVLLYEAGEARTGLTLAEAAQAIGRPGTLVWVDSSGQTPDLEAFVQDTLGLHRLTEEDIWAAREAPKVEAFPEYLFVLAHGVRIQGDTPEEQRRVRRPSDLEVAELDC